MEGPEWERKYEAEVERNHILAREGLEAAAETAAMIRFLETELAWEDFRGEMLGSSESEKNAAKIMAFLKVTGHGLRLLERLEELEQKQALHKL